MLIARNALSKGIGFTCRIVRIFDNIMKVMKSMIEYNYILKVKSLGRNFETPGETDSDNLDIDYWRSAQKKLSRKTYVVGEAIVDVDIDLSSVPKRLKHNARVSHDIRKATGDERSQLWDDFETGELELPCRISTASSQHHSDEVLKYHLYDFFLIMNLASPGSCDFYSAKIVNSEEEFQIPLSSYHFEFAFTESCEGKWPNVSNHSFNETIDWYDGARSDFSQIPDSKVEKVLFAILHLARGEVSPVQVIYIFFALETLFETKPGQNLTSLVDRIAQLLECTDSEKAKLKKWLRGLYNLRSSFVHGGLQVGHPMYSMSLDNRVQKQFDDHLNLIDNGFAVLLSSVQKIISLGWHDVTFFEKMVGIPQKK